MCLLVFSTEVAEMNAFKSGKRTFLISDVMRCHQSVSHFYANNDTLYKTMNISMFFYFRKSCFSCFISISVPTEKENIQKQDNDYILNGAPGRTVLQTDGVLLGIDIINK